MRGKILTWPKFLHTASTLTDQAKFSTLKDLSRKVQNCITDDALMLKWRSCACTAQLNSALFLLLELYLWLKHPDYKSRALNRKLKTVVQ